jgi:hypothetical protein
VREQLADYAHEAWSGWMRYLFEKSQTNPDGSVTIPATLVARWQRQMNSPYGSLPENEKESDRAEADKMLAIVELVWTRKKPTEPGFYCYKPNKAAPWFVVQVHREWRAANDTGLDVEFGDGPEDLKRVNGWWGGPIPEPQEPQL